MSKHYERIARIESVDPDSGVFQMTMATEGEASDGHILSIKGGRIPAKMPLLPSHGWDPREQLGSVTNPQKALGEKPPRLRGVGQIEMDGVGTPLEVRQDLAHMIAAGHVGAVSIRWDEVDDKPPVRRVNLPSDHPFFVDEAKEKSYRKRWGLYFEHWQGLETSIVALGADKQALIGRAEETEGAVSTFWRSMADTIDDPEDNGEPDQSSQIEAALAVLRIEVADCREAGAKGREMRDAFVSALTIEEKTDVSDGREEDFQSQRAELLTHLEAADRANIILRSLVSDSKEKLEAAEQRATAAEAALEEGRVIDDPPASNDEERVKEGDPLLPDVMRPREVLSFLEDELNTASRRVHRKFRAEIEKARGRIDQ